MKLSFLKTVAIAILMVSMLMVVSCKATKNASDDDGKKDEKIVLQLGHTQTTEHLIHQAAVDFATLVKEKSEGNIEVEVYPSETLGTNKELADACSTGDVDFYISATGQYTQRYKPFTVVEAFYMFRDTDHLFRFYESDIYNELVKGLAEACDVHVLAPLYYGARLMTTKGTPLNNAEDFKGLKFRVANEPLPVAAIETLEGTPTPIAYSEVYLSLQQGVVDGQENPAGSILAMKFYEVQDYLNLTYHQFQMLSLFMSDLSMKEKLSKEQIDLIYEAAVEASDAHNKRAVQLETDYINEIGEHCEIINTNTESFAKKIKSMYAKFTPDWGEGTVEKIKAIQ